tara:strand:+ start:1248 stop:1682 length:435 start_codon:yes stop_codon:yes gene_type:complete
MVNVGYNMKFESKNLNAIHDILNENVNDKQTVYSEGPTPLTTEQKREFHEAVKTFSQMGESVYGKGRLKEVVERITSIVETASQLVTEKEDMVDSINAGRQMKGITEALKQFQKSANEVLIHERRMEAAFEDIAHGVGNYFEVG